MVDAAFIQGAFDIHWPFPSKDPGDSFKRQARFGRKRPEVDLKAQDICQSSAVCLMKLLHFSGWILEILLGTGTQHGNSNAALQEVGRARRF